MKRALIIEDETSIRENLEELLGEEGYDVLSAGDGATGIQLAFRHRPDIIVCDIVLPKTDGYGVLGAVRAHALTASTPFVFLTAKAEKSDVRAGMNLGADDYITKPFTNDELVAALDARIERARKMIARPAEARRTTARGPVVQDPAMQAVYEQIDLVARDLIAVLLLGETGVGKEVLARAIHDRSPRAAAPFVPLNCAALSESLLEAELFGHEKAAFTGATHEKKGLFETAHGGTVFLDELGELPPATQVKLLRVLQEREVLRIGGRTPTRVDVRFVAATNRDLEAAIAAGAFREDLYYRVAGFVIQVPPLRARPLDVMALAERFAVAACEVSGRSVPAFSADAERLLNGHAWPGNVRELKNAVERALVLCGGGPIGAEHFALRAARVSRPPESRSADARAPEGRSVESHGPDSRVPEPKPLSPITLAEEQATLERQRILEALERFAGNQTKAADHLGMSRRTLVSRLTEYGLPRPRKR